MHRFTEPTPLPTRADLISVFVENWEIECCGVPPVVGYDTTWALTFIESASERGRSLPDGARWRRRTHLITAGGIEAYWPTTDTPQVNAVFGYFPGTRHGPTVPDGIHPTTGLVVDLQLEIVEYQQTTATIGREDTTKAVTDDFMSMLRHVSQYSRFLINRAEGPENPERRRDVLTDADRVDHDRRIPVEAPRVSLASVISGVRSPRKQDRRND